MKWGLFCFLLLFEYWNWKINEMKRENILWLQTKSPFFLFASSKIERKTKRKKRKKKKSFEYKNKNILCLIPNRKIHQNQSLDEKTTTVIIKSLYKSGSLVWFFESIEIEWQRWKIHTKKIYCSKFSIFNISLFQTSLFLEHLVLKHPSISNTSLSQKSLYLKHPSISNIPLSQTSLYLKHLSISNTSLPTGLSL